MLGNTTTNYGQTKNYAEDWKTLIIKKSGGHSVIYQNYEYIITNTQSPQVNIYPGNCLQ